MTTSVSVDSAFMERALVLAERGRCAASPNPSVGCVLVRDGQVISEGWTQRAGGPHAEAHALLRAEGEVVGATAYVTLEPCNHHGRTPPCSEALVGAGVARVVAAMEDPHPAVSGSGLARLRSAGIETQCGLHAERAFELNAGFFQRVAGGRPRVTLKLAQSIDGRTAMPDGESQWITGADSRRDVQWLRARSCAVVTGVGSILLDDSRLTVRSEELGSDIDVLQPLRVVLDSRLRTPPDAKVRTGPGDCLLVAACQPQETADHIIVLPNATGGVDLGALLDELSRRECNEVLFECGARLAGSVLAGGYADEVITYVAGKVLGHAARPLANLAPGSLSAAPRLELIEVSQLGGDARLRWRRATD